MSDATFGPHGTLWSYSIQNYPPPPPARYDEPYVPYALGVVDLADGLRVVGRMKVDDPASLRVGEPVELVVGVLYHDGGRHRAGELDVPPGMSPTRAGSPRRRGGVSMREVAVLGVGMHPWGKFPESSVTELCRTAVQAALADAGVSWRDDRGRRRGQLPVLGRQGLGPERQRHRRGHGLHRDPRLQHVGGMRGRRQRLQRRPLPRRRWACTTWSSSSAARRCRRASSRPPASRRRPIPSTCARRCVGMPGPAFWALLCRRRMAELGTTEEQLAQVAVKAHEIGKHNENARFRQEFSLDQVLESAMVSDPLRLYEICPVSDGAAAAVICSAERARQLDLVADLGGRERGRDGPVRRRAAARSRRHRPVGTGPPQRGGPGRGEGAGTGGRGTDRARLRGAAGQHRVLRARLPRGLGPVRAGRGREAAGGR